MNFFYFYLEIFSINLNARFTSARFTSSMNAIEMGYKIKAIIIYFILALKDIFIII
jgi:hypothetical protein